MFINIRQRLRPFSHQPGIECLLPGSNQVVRIFPTRVVMGETFDLPIKGPVADFNVEQNLERGYVEVSGRAREGYFRYQISPKGIHIKKAPFEFPSAEAPDLLPEGERLSFGCHKSQDWEMVARRADVRELLPFWYRLGKVTPAPPLISGFSLLDRCQEIAHARGREQIGAALVELFRAGFRGMLVPQAIDHLHQGYPMPPIPELADPLQLLTGGAALIRSLFIHEGEKIHLLPCLPVECHAGRFCNVQCSLGTLQIEWTKKVIRRVALRADRDGEAHFVFQPHVRTFRLRKKERLDAGAPFPVSQGELIWLDRFEK